MCIDPVDFVKETWKPVVGYEGCYLISSKGRIKSLPRTVTVLPSKGISFARKIEGRLLQLRYDKHGYAHVNLFSGAIGQTHRVHRLVAEAFIPNPLQFPVVMHLDDNPSNNCMRNLQWATQRANVHDMVSKGRRKGGGNKQTGSSASQTKLSEDQVIEIRSLLRSGKTQRSIAAQFGVSHVAIWAISKKLSWKHLDS